MASVLLAVGLASILVGDPPPSSPEPALPAADVAASPATASHVASQVEALQMALRSSPSGPSPLPRATLPRVYGWLGTGPNRRRVKCLLDSGATHCFVHSALASQLGPACVTDPRGGPSMVRQADGSSRATQGTVEAPLALGDMEETTRFSVFDVDCDADVILGFDWLRAHDLTFLYDENQVCFCAERGCLSGRRIRADLIRPGASSPDAASLLRSNQLLQLLGVTGLAVADPLSGPARWSRPPPGRFAAHAAHLAAAAQDAWAADSLAALAEGGVSLADGTELLLGSIHLAAATTLASTPSCPEADPPEFSILASEYADVLGGPPPGLPPDRGPEFELRIDTGTAPMPRSRPMKRWSQGELDECRRQVALLLDNGWIRPSTASHAASVVFARKADGTWRFCQDYRALNGITQRSVEPLPHVDQLVDETRGARFFTKLDLASAYHQFRIRTGDQYKTSFRVPGGQFEFRVGAFGLHGMSSLLMRYMHSIFGRSAPAFDADGRLRPPGTGTSSPMLGRFVQVYMDDILIFSKTKAEHLVHVRMVLETLRHYQLFAKASKCQFGRSSVGFLGHVISERGVGVDPAKVEAIREWARPSTCTDVRRFVGLANYYRRFVPRFSDIAAPLTALCSPRASFVWAAAEQRSFDDLKTALTSAPVLRVWDPARPTRLVTDASELAVSGILEQPDDRGVFHPVAYESRKLTSPERAYPPHLLELLAVVHCLKAFRPYLLDQPFELHTDNASLQWFQQQRTLSHQQARWLNLLSEFKFKVVHIPGRSNPADFLSRMNFPSGSGPALATGYNDPDSTQELFTVSSHARLACAFTQVAADGPRFLTPNFSAAVGGAILADPALAKLALAAQAHPGQPVTAAGLPAPPESSHSFVWRAGLLFRRGARGDRLCIPDDAALKRLVLQELHATPLGGHFGRDKTTALALRSVWWPSLKTDLDEFVRSCPTCQRVKAEHGTPPGLLYPLPVPTRRGGTIGLDFVEMPTASSGHDFLQVHIDFLTGRVWLVPTWKRATAAVAADNFVASVFRDVGLPDTLVSDRDTRFTSEFWTSLHVALGTSLIFGSPHHHNTNARTERVNGVIADVLRSFVSERQDNWPSLIPLVEFAINDSASPLGMGYTPFFADRGQHPRRPLSAPADTSLPPATDGVAVARLMDHVTGEVRALLHESQALRKARMDPHRKDVQFSPGDEVLLDTAHTPLPSRDRLSPRWMGPFRVLAKTAPNTYRLAVPPAWRAFDEFNVERLRRYVRRPFHLGGDSAEPPPEVGADGALEHVVAEILRFRLRAGRPQLLVRWEGKDASGDTWEPLENLTNCEQAIRDFELAQGVVVPRPLPPPTSQACGGSSPPLPPAGFVVDPSPGDLGPDLVGRRVLYLWPEDGWQQGTVARASRRAPYTHVVAYHRSTSALRGTADSLLDAASYGSRWVLLSPAAPRGVAAVPPRALRPRGNPP